MITRREKVKLRGYIGDQIPVILEITHEIFDPENIDVSLTLLSDNNALKGAFQALLSGDDSGRLTIHGGPDSRSIALTGISGWNFSGAEASIDIHSYTSGLEVVLPKGIGDCWVEVSLTPSGILRQAGGIEMSYDGTVTHPNAAKGEITWASPVGEAKASTIFKYENEDVYDNQTIVQVPQPTLSFGVASPAGNQVSEIISQVRDETDEICLLLSLCYRKMVSWYGMRLTAISSGKNREIYESVTRKKVYRSSYPDHDDELVSYRDLLGGGLAALLQEFRASQIKEGLQRSIVFLSVSSELATIEVQYFHAFIALETFCDSFVSKYPTTITIPAGKWKKMEALLRRSLDPLNHEDFGVYVNKVKTKLPELKSSALIDKVLEAAHLLEVETSDLWPRVSFADGLSEALGMRNKLFHRAENNAPYLLFANLVRVQILVERLILSHLKWPNDKIWNFYDQKLRRIQS